MFDWLTQPNEAQNPVHDILDMAGHLVAAFGLGMLVAGIYYFTNRKPGEKANLSFLATLIILAGLIGLVTLVIGNSVARAFSLVGALAIVRFRTVVDDTRDTAFVMFSVAAGMSAGTGNLAPPLLCMPLVLAVSWFLRPRDNQKSIHATLTIRLAISQNSNQDLQKVLNQHLLNYSLAGLSTARGGSAVDSTYEITLTNPKLVFELVQTLNQIDGIQAVEVRTHD